MFLKLDKEELTKKGSQQIIDREKFCAKIFNHPNLVKFYKVIEYEKISFLIEEFMENGTMEIFVEEFKKANNGKNIPQDIVLYLFSQI